MKEDPRKGRRAFQALFADTQDNVEIIVSLGVMTRRKLFTEWVRDMWLLWHELLKGETAQLLKMFPDMAARLTTHDEEMQRLEAKIDLLLSRPAAPAVDAAPAVTGKSLSMPKFAAPIIDDEDTIVLNKDTTSGQNAANDFLSSVLNLQ